MNNHDCDPKKIGWKLTGLAIATSFTYTGIINQIGFPKKVANSALASEIKSNLLSVRENIPVIETVTPQNSPVTPVKKMGLTKERLRQLNILSVEKTQPTPASSQEETDIEIKQEDQIDFSDTGRAGQQSAGEGRGDCGSTEFPLTALVPTSNWGKTTKAHPIFWFYVPTYSSSVTEIEFVVQDQDRNPISKQQFSTDGTSNYLSVNLSPEQAELETGKWYRWYFKVYCDLEKRYPPKVVYGWVKRVRVNSTLQSQLKSSNQHPYFTYAKADIWFDAIDSLLQSQNLDKKSIYFKKAWQQLIEAKGVDLDLPIPKCSDLALK